MKRAVAAIMCLSACAPMASTERGDVLTVWNDSGSLVSAAEQERRWIERGRDYRRIEIAGTCASSCAFGALRLPQTCYTNGARIGLHPYSYGGLVVTPYMRQITAERVALLPKGLRDWWERERPTVLGQDLTYDDLKRIMPEREC